LRTLKNMFFKTCLNPTKIFNMEKPEIKSKCIVCGMMYGLKSVPKNCNFCGGFVELVDDDWEFLEDDFKLLENKKTIIKKQYIKGRRKEYAICEQLREEGFDIVQRSAGSHSKVDIFAIDTKGRRIKLVQCKRVLSQSMNTINEQLKTKIESEMSYLNGVYNCVFIVL